MAEKDERQIQHFRDLSVELYRCRKNRFTALLCFPFLCLLLGFFLTVLQFGLDVDFSFIAVILGFGLCIWFTVLIAQICSIDRTIWLLDQLAAHLRKETEEVQSDQESPEHNAS
ncbi:MAG: hypothetical protein KDA77_23210 [Planctomycetaceae bacterium]|nr:hypothetical protein [Planctomycetaceae bacterium]